MIGASHRTAPVELREKLAFSQEESAALLNRFRSDEMFREGILFSTCNRTEVLFIPHENQENPVEKMVDLISAFKGIKSSEFKPALYVHEGDEAVRHIFRVAASLDSMMVGEPQILGQVKQAYRMAVECKTSGVLVNRMMHKAFSVAKRVRKETGIGDNAVSISYAAIELAHKIFSDLSTKKAMLLGAGEMAELAVEHLAANKVSHIYVANRTFKNAMTLARKFDGEAVRFEDRGQMLKDVDIIISSTGAQGYVLTRDQVKTAMKKRNHRTLFFIDIAVPRDIDPDIGNVPNAYVYDIDDLESIVHSNIRQREQETFKAERFVEQAVFTFQKWMDSLSIVPTIKAINDKMTQIVEMEFEKTIAHLGDLSEEEIQAIQRMTRAIASRAMHDPIKFLRNIGDHRSDSLYLNATRQLFNLDVKE